MLEGQAVNPERILVKFAQGRETPTAWMAGLRDVLGSQLVGIQVLDHVGLVVVNLQSVANTADLKAATLEERPFTEAEMRSLNKTNPKFFARIPVEADDPSLGTETTPAI